MPTRNQIHAGGLYVDREGGIVETVLGSCVAACLYDAEAGVGGMNHYLLPHGSADDPLPYRYGEFAMRELLHGVLRLGASRDHVQAKLFGAASVLRLDEKRFSVPRQNAAFARHFLLEEGIPLAGEKLGGHLPLRIKMFTGTGRVLATAVSRTLVSKVAAIESREYSDVLSQRWAWFLAGPDTRRHEQD